MNLNHNLKYFLQFFLIGVTAAIVDYLTYIFLLYKLGFLLDLSKFCGTLAGLFASYYLNFTFNFGGNNRKTFSNTGIYLGIYIVLNSINVLNNRILFNLTNNVNVAFIVAGGTSAIINYIVTKQLLFRKKI